MMSETPETLHISGFGKKLRKHHELLAVEWNEEEQKKSMFLTPSTLEHLILSGEHMVSTGAMRLMLKNDVCLSLLDKYGTPVGYLFSHVHGKQLDTWEKQMILDPIHRLDIARDICLAAAKNKMSVLQSIKKNRGINFDGSLMRIQDAMSNMEIVDDVSMLMGYEGQASNAYFTALKELVPEDLHFSGRIKHPSPDPVNVMLSYGYGILYSKVRFALMQARLNPYYGVLHSNYKKQEALVYDLIEEFRQPIVDKTILTMLGRKQVSVDDFSMDGDMCIMNDNFKKEFSGAVLDRLASSSQYMGNDVEFNEILNRQAVGIRDAIMKRTVYKAYEYKWW